MPTAAMSRQRATQSLHQRGSTNGAVEHQLQSCIPRPPKHLGRTGSSSGSGIDAEGVYVDELAFRYPPKKPKSLRISASSGESVGNRSEEHTSELQSPCN